MVSTDQGVSLDIFRLRETGLKIIYSANLPLYINGGKDAIPRIISNFVEIIQIMAFNKKAKNLLMPLKVSIRQKV